MQLGSNLHWIKLANFYYQCPDRDLGADPVIRLVGRFASSAPAYISCFGADRRRLPMRRLPVRRLPVRRLSMRTRTTLIEAETHATYTLPDYSYTYMKRPKLVRGARPFHGSKTAAGMCADPPLTQTDRLCRNRASERARGALHTHDASRGCSCLVPAQSSAELGRGWAWTLGFKDEQPLDDDAPRFVHVNLCTSLSTCRTSDPRDPGLRRRRSSRFLGTFGGVSKRGRVGGEGLGVQLAGRD